MNYFKSIMLTAFAIVALAACDTDDLKDDINDLKGRVESLEAQVNLLNDNMTAIKRLLEGGQTITNVVENNGTYTITLFDNSTITLTQGVKGAAKIPEITVVDGYWVVERTQLKDQNGNPVRAEGATGEAGATPKFQITEEGSYWQVSFDGGKTWENVLDENNKPVSAVSTEGGSSSDTFFESAGVDESGEFFKITLKGGNSYSIPISTDLICEIIKPEKGFKNGFWEIGFGETVRTDVKVKGDNVMVTAPAGWVATISDPNPADHTATLTITAPANASAVQTRATADNSSDVTVQVNKGANWKVAKIQVKAVEIIDSYYAIYEAGKTFTLGGVEINKQKFPTITHITEDGTNITKAGVYFIDKGLSVNFTGAGNIDNNLLIIGDNPDEKNTVNFKQFARLAKENGTFACMNITIKVTELTANYLFNINTNITLQNVLFDNCRIQLGSKDLTYINGTGNANRYINNFVMENTISEINQATARNIINYNSGSTYENVTFKNNIFYCPSGKVNRLALFNGGSATITNLTIENNTFVNMESIATGFASFTTLTSAAINKNIFWTNTAGTANAQILSKAPTAITSYKNIVYKTMKYSWSLYPNVPAEVENLKIIETDPFANGTFDITNGIFIPSAEYAEYGASIN